MGRNKDVYSVEEHWKPVEKQFVSVKHRCKLHVSLSSQRGGPQIDIVFGSILPCDNFNLLALRSCDGPVYDNSPVRACRG